MDNPDIEIRFENDDRFCRMSRSFISKFSESFLTYFDDMDERTIVLGADIVTYDMFLQVITVLEGNFSFWESPKTVRQFMKKYCFADIDFIICYKSLKEQLFEELASFDKFVRGKGQLFFVPKTLSYYEQMKIMATGKYIMPVCIMTLRLDMSAMILVHISESIPLCCTVNDYDSRPLIWNLECQDQIIDVNKTRKSMASVLVQLEYTVLDDENSVEDYYTDDFDQYLSLFCVKEKDDEWEHDLLKMQAPKREIRWDSLIPHPFVSNVQQVIEKMQLSCMTIYKDFLRNSQFDKPVMMNSTEISTFYLFLNLEKLGALSIDQIRHIFD